MKHYEIDIHNVELRIIVNWLVEFIFAMFIISGHKIYNRSQNNTKHESTVARGTKLLFIIIFTLRPWTSMEYNIVHRCVKETCAVFGKTCLAQVEARPGRT